MEKGSSDWERMGKTGGEKESAAAQTLPFLFIPLCITLSSPDSTHTTQTASAFGFPFLFLTPLWKENKYCKNTGQMADSMYNVVWVSGLLMSMLCIEWPMVAVGLWYGQAYVMDNEHRCILLMAFWMHRDTVTRSWGPMLCHSSTAITSCHSMIIHGPMLQGSVHNS